MRFFLLLIAFLMLSPLTAYAQTVQDACARNANDDRLRPIGAALVAPARAVFGLAASAPDEWVRASTVARCMGGKVWLCNRGANIPCGKANARRANAGASAFCRQNPGADSVPMAATGHDTLYAYMCRGAVARVAKQVSAVDARGFVADAWKRLPR